MCQSSAASLQRLACAREGIRHLGAEAIAYHRLGNGEAHAVERTPPETGCPSPDMTESISAQSLTVRPIGPIESSVLDSGRAPWRDIRTCVGLKPTRPQN